MKKPKAAKPVEEKWIPANLEGAWIEETSGMVLLRVRTGGYRGEWGAYCEKTVDVKLAGVE